MAKYKTTDHNGKKFSSINEMCNYHNISSHIYRQRIKMGYDKKTALTKPVRSYKTKPITDHLGNTYDSIIAMCRAYGLAYNKYSNRIKAGWSQEDALTKKHSNEIKDHKGNTFRSKELMCKHYHISKSLYERRKAENWPLDQILKTRRSTHRDLYILDYPTNLVNDIISDMADINILTSEQIKKIAKLANQTLNCRQLDVIKYRYKNKMTLQEIADKYNVTASFIGQDIINSRRRIRTNYEHDIKNILKKD